jgi:NAD(P)H-nitrite reductase large subunit
VRRCTIPGCELPGILYLRGIADADAMRPHFISGARLAVVGGG